MNAKKLITFLIYLFPVLAVVPLQAQQAAKLDLAINPGTVSRQILHAEGDQIAELPVMVIKGKEDGPVFTIVAGIHGFEYPPIIAVQQLMSEIQPENLKGTLLILPVANVHGFFGRMAFYNPQDGKNLNRVFPGNVIGTISDRLAYLISSEVISRSDVFLDIHAGDANEDLLDFVCYYENKNFPEKTGMARRLAESSGFAFQVVYPFNLTKNQQAEYAFKQASQQGITALSIEAGGLGTVQEKSVARIKTGVFNMLYELNMYPKINKKADKKLTLLNGQKYLKAPAKGIFYSDLKSGDKVEAGQKIGFIADLFGRKLMEITTDQDGIILYKIGTPPVLQDETLFCIGFSK